MTDRIKIRDVFCFEIGPLPAMPVSVDVPIESEVQLCLTGSFYRADMGHFKITQRTLEKMIYNAIERGVDIPISYYHLSSDPLTPISERKSAGWVKPSSLSIRGYKGGQGLFGIARWNAEAVQKLKAQEVKYISPEIEWSAVRMAASEAGPAGESIGPLLTKASLVDDPFFNMNPVTFSRRPSASKRYSMLTPAAEAKINAILTEAGIKADQVAGIAAQIILAAMMTEDAPSPEDVMPVDVMPAATPAPAAEGAAQQSLAASREVITGLSNRVKELEARDAARVQEQDTTIFARYKAEGRFRIFAVQGTDPDGTKKATALLKKGSAFFREVFDAVPSLTGTQAPAAPQGLTRNSTPSQPGDSPFTDANGIALHNRTMDEIRANKQYDVKKDYARISAQFARQK